MSRAYAIFASKHAQNRFPLREAQCPSPCFIASLYCLRLPVDIIAALPSFERSVLRYNCFSQVVPLRVSVGSVCAPLSPIGRAFCPDLVGPWVAHFRQSSTHSRTPSVVARRARTCEKKAGWRYLKELLPGSYKPCSNMIFFRNLGRKKKNLLQNCL